MGSPSEDADRLLTVALARPATLGTGRLICLDGPAGSGKTTLADALRSAAPDATVLHTDDLLAGWDGLPGLAATIEAFLAPLAAGRSGHWRRWDWRASAWAETHEVRPGGLLVLEGVGSWSPGIAPLVTLLVWLDAPADVRRRRALARDGDVFAPHWEAWARDESAVLARDRTREHADLVLATGTPPAVPAPTDVRREEHPPAPSA